MNYRCENSNSELTDKLQNFLTLTDKDTPYLVIDLDAIRQKYHELVTYMPSVKCFYSVKSNSSPQILQALLEQGSNFEAASIGEIELCIKVGVAPANIHFGNTVKTIQSIQKSYDYGIRSFAFDCKEELDKIVLHAPESNVICRIETTGEGATWGLCRKFGCTINNATALLLRAKTLNMGNLGVSFHVGSQQKQPLAWKRALLDTQKIITSLKALDLEVDVINIGGGFPASGYLGEDNTPAIYDFKHYGGEITSYIQEIFGDDHHYNFMCEPGRFLLAQAGCIKTQIILATDKNIGNELQRWLYLDIGKFNGLYEGTDIKHPISYAGSSQSKLITTTLAGPSCDSDDMLSYGSDLHLLPSEIIAGEYLTFKSTGAYSSSYVTSGFNGIPPLNEYYI